MPAIFLSYRRADSDQVAIRIRQWLIHHGVPEDEIFFDNRSIRPGAPFPEAIREALETARVALVIIGPNWLSHKSGKILRRRSLDAPDDWVRKEVELALQEEQRTQPVLLAATGMPQTGQLPRSIRALHTLQAVRLRIDDAGFEEDMLVLA